MQRSRPAPEALETASPSPRSDNNPLGEFGTRLGRDRAQESLRGHSPHSISSTISRDNTAGCGSHQAALLADWGRKQRERDAKPLLFPALGPRAGGVHFDKDFHDMYPGAANPEALIRQRIIEIAPGLAAASFDKQKLPWQILLLLRIVNGAKGYIAEGIDPLKILLEYKVSQRLSPGTLARIQASRQYRLQYPTVLWPE